MTVYDILNDQSFLLVTNLATGKLGGRRAVSVSGGDVVRSRAGPFGAMMIVLNSVYSEAETGNAARQLFSGALR